ncbi:MAG TPA: serine hydrolase domain-containing protein, partial [Thermoanaerobaculia bacterium]|nr:serine hydrolase domain-containing protein [Thermoanaerobaculia bacterium]
MNAIEQFLQHEIDIGSFPSASYAIGTRDELEHTGALGNAVAVPMRIRATTDTIYDCASLTKVLITTPLVLRAFALDDRVHGYTVRELLTHTSGLRAWLPLYTFDDPLRAILEHGPECERGTRVIYSDLNFVLLWLALPGFASQARSLIASLGLRDAQFTPPAALRPRIAATEWGQRYEAAMAKAPLSGLRQGLMWGEVHDGNAWHLGGTAGHAGLFATARDVFHLVQAFARGALVPASLVAEATREQAPGRG